MRKECMSMAFAGVDVGAKTVKVVMIDGEKTSWSLLPVRFDEREALRRAFDDALQGMGLKQRDVERTFATGVGCRDVEWADGTITEVTAEGRGAFHLVPTARTVLSIGAEGARCIGLDESGRVVDFAMNEKCAAGVGAFIEAMARALEVSVEQMAELSLVAEGRIRLNAQCVVFAESEVVTLIHSETPKPDIARAIHDSIAHRAASMVGRLGARDDVVVIGGVAKNGGFVDSLRKMLGSDVVVPDEPEFVGALGAALLAADR